MCLCKPCTHTPTHTRVLRRSFPPFLQVFLIRHGESKWNDAQSHHSLKNMMRQVDHELTDTGVEGSVSASLSPNKHTASGPYILHTTQLASKSAEAQILNSGWKEAQSGLMAAGKDPDELKRIGKFLAAELVCVFARVCGNMIHCSTPKFNPQLRRKSRWSLAH